MKKILAVVFVLMLGGCTPMPPLNFSVPNVGVSPKKVDAELKSMTVTLGRPDEAKGDLPMGVEATTALWQTALQEAIDRMAIFKDDASRKVNIQVKVLAINIPSFGASFTTSTIARYEIIDRANGSIIYTQEISADGVVPATHAFVGVVRARESINRSVQNNISQFLQALGSVDVNKPMFPAPAQQ